MNKNRYICIFAAIAAVVTLLVACSPDLTENVSELRSGYFAAEDDTFKAVAVSGRRESNYVADGIAGELVPYTLITVTPKAFDPDAVYTFTAKTDSASYGGTFTVHPFAASFSAEIAAEMTADFTLTVSAGENVYEYSLVSCVTHEMMTFDRAIEAAKTELKPENVEIRARLIQNPVGDGLCWHVAFYGSDGTQSGVLLDPVTAKVLAKK